MVVSRNFSVLTLYALRVCCDNVSVGSELSCHRNSSDYCVKCTPYRFDRLPVVFANETDSFGELFTNTSNLFGQVRGI